MSKAIDVSGVDEIQVVNFKPGDTLVLRVEGVLTDRAAENIERSIGAVSGLHAIILEDGMSLESVLRCEE